MDNFDLVKYMVEGRLLKEVEGKPKGIILAGGAGVGKSYVIKNLLGDLDDKTGIFTPKGSDLKFKYMNPDDLVEKKGLSLGAAMGEFRGIFQDAQNKSENIIWDTTAANVKNTSSQMPGYDKFMAMVYTHPIISILQNTKRERTLPLNAVIKTWEGVYSNIEDYRKIFGENFVFIKNTIPGYDKQIQEFDKAVAGGKESLKQYLEKLSSDNVDQFKSSFSKDFTFKDEEIEIAFNEALPQTSFDEKKDMDLLKTIQKSFEKEYEKSSSNPGYERLEKNLKSAQNTQLRNDAGYNEDLEGIVDKLTSSKFKEITEPTPESDIKLKFNSFING